jgi:hypothetical protein
LALAAAEEEEESFFFLFLPSLPLLLLPLFLVLEFLVELHPEEWESNVIVDMPPLAAFVSEVLLSAQDVLLFLLTGKLVVSPPSTEGSRPCCLLLLPLLCALPPLFLYVDCP